MSVNRKPAKTLAFDLVVVGGGLAGVCAAISAARNGVRTAIIQDRPVFGGNSSSEIRVVPYGSAQSHAWAAETGIVNELLLDDRASNHQDLFTHGMTNSLYDMNLFEAVRREPNLTHFLNTSVRAVDAFEEAPGQRRIRAVHGSQLASEEEFIFTAEQFIDATGDGTVGYLAGADWRQGRESRHEFGENLAPIHADEVTMGATITMRAQKIDRPVTYSPPHWIEQYRSPEDIGVERKLLYVNQDVFGGYWWLEVGYPYDQITQTQEIKEELHRHVLGIWNYIKNHSPDRAGAANHVLDWIGQVPGKRESRRLVGDVILSEHDTHTDRNWPDGIAYAGWWIDLHIKGGILNRSEPAEREDLDDNYKHWIRVSPFSIPLRASYSRNVSNLWMTGRIISVTHVALGPVRVQLTLGQHGQAIGAAAAYALKHKLTPRQTADPEGPHIQQLRQQLIRQDVRLLGVVNSDPDDLARKATVRASSSARLQLGQPSNGWTPLSRATAQILPVTATRLDSVEILLHNDDSEPRRIEAELHALNRIWDRETGRVVGRASATIGAGEQGWVRLSFNTATEPDKPYRLALEPTPGVSWAHGPAMTGTTAHYRYRCPGGPEARHRHLPSFGPDEIQIPAYEHWRQIRHITFATRGEPEFRPYEASAAVNGRAWPENMPNLWISDPAEPLPQWLQLDWTEPQRISKVLVSFDTQLDLTTSERPGFWKAPECARDWQLQVRNGDKWKTVFTETGNYQRRRTATFEPVVTDSLRLLITATNGDPSARVFEVRVYQ
jgi:hypothetical protein